MSVATKTSQIALPLEVVLSKRPEASTTFLKNLSLPIHRWYRFSAGFSASWVREVLQQGRAEGRSRVLDPFAGSGTVVLEAEKAGYAGVGLEAHPVISRIAKAKLLWREDPSDFLTHATEILDQAPKYEASPLTYPKLITKCFPAKILQRLDALHQSWLSTADGSPRSELTWLALLSILRECSPVGTAQWQYVLPNKSKMKALDPYESFANKVRLMAQDMDYRQQFPHGTHGKLYQADARSCEPLPDGWADLIITSPPYANNYDYADATRLELCFFREIDGWGDLQQTIRKHLVRSCTQHVAKLNGEVYNILKSPLLTPIHSAILDVCERLEIERHSHGGKKAYHTMIAAYFLDMAEMWIALRRVTAPGALVCFVVGDSAPYGIYVPVEKWLGELAMAAGFKSYSFEKLRDRNVKWKNRKHRVPLHEGRLWLKG